MARRRRNKIELLKNDTGEWVDNLEALKDLACSFFQRLYSLDMPTVPSYTVKGKFPPIKAFDMIYFQSSVSPDEVRAALFDIKPWKAPRPEGFQAGFFQSQWSWIGNCLFNEVSRVMAGGPLGGTLNNTLISLILKVSSPVVITDFRPTSLCSVLYKIIIKVIANHLKTFCLM